MRILPLAALALLSLLAGCTTVESERPGAGGEPAPARNEEILVAKRDLARASDNLKLVVIEVRPGESPAQAARRSLGVELAADVRDLLNNRPAADRPGNPAPAPPPAAPERCDDSCQWALDGTCDDGGPDSASAWCARGTDCSDCGGLAPGGAAPPREPAPAPDPAPEPADPAPRPDPAPPPPPPPAGEGGCTDGCRFARDGECDDGRPGAATSLCLPGTDCSDCEPGRAAPPPPPPPPPRAAEDPEAPGQACLAEGQQGRCGDRRACAGLAVPGYCPGPADIQCCVPEGAANAADHPAIGQRCDAAGMPGTCQRVAACAGEPVPGYCAGPADIQCCVGAGQRKAVQLAAVAVWWGVRQLAVVVIRSQAPQAAAYVGTAAIAAHGVNGIIEEQRQVGVYIDPEDVARAEGWRDDQTVTFDPVVGPMADRYLAQAQRPGAVAEWGEVAAEPMDPPGDCTATEYEAYREAKRAQCRESYRCRGDAGVRAEANEILRDYAAGQLRFPHNRAARVVAFCEDISARLAQANRCFDARGDIMDACFRGGDANHWAQLNEVDNARLNCEQIYTQHLCEHFAPGSPLNP